MARRQWRLGLKLFRLGLVCDDDDGDSVESIRVMKPSLIVFSIFLCLTSAAFSDESTACWQRNCIFADDSGTICLEANGNGVAPSKCTSTVLQNLIRAHHGNINGTRITYYDEKGYILGGATWPVPNPLTSPVFVCMTGQRRDNPSIDRTVCRSVTKDNDMEDYAAHVHECVVDQPATPRPDPCYRAPNPSKPVRKKPCYSHPAFIGIFGMFGLLVTVGTIYEDLAKKCTALTIRLRNCWFDWRRRERERLPAAAAHGHNNQRVQLNPIRMPVAQPFEPTRAGPYHREGYEQPH